jgi:hypothetical protein
VLPTVGVQNTTWNATSTAAGGSAAIGISSNTILSVDPPRQLGPPAARARTRALDYPETLFANSPRDGYTFRPAATTTAVGGAREIREFDTLGLRGMGFSAVVIPSNSRSSFSVNQP